MDIPSAFVSNKAGVPKRVREDWKKSSVGEKGE